MHLVPFEVVPLQIFCWAKASWAGLAMRSVIVSNRYLIMALVVDMMIESVLFAKIANVVQFGKYFYGFVS